MNITVVICTWNRANLLDQTLDAMHRLKIPEGILWELIVVNNNCTDTTDEIIAYHSENLPVVRVFEAQKGLSNARNAGVSAAKGDYIIWTDDDVIVDEDWIAAYVAAFREHPEASIFGGPISPWFEGSAPAWMEQSWPIIKDTYATRDLGGESFALTNDHLPYGANFALCTTEQKKHIFDPNLGLVHGKILVGEETKVLTNVLKKGGTGWWVPGARVRHWIPRSRQNLKYIRRYFIGFGRSMSREKRLDSVRWYSKPWWLWLLAVQNECLYLLTRCFCGSDVWMVYLKTSSIAWGELFN